MGLSASMWTSVSGLLSHGNKMNVVGNNLANVSTIGFKSQRMDFNDYLYLNGGSTSGPTQIGAGVSTYAIIGDFSQGSFESTNSVTDLAIDGEGFFKVRQPNTNQSYYTRAGDFYFNADRQLQNPEGYRLQGWKVDNKKSALTFLSESVNLGKNTKDESAFVGSGTPQDIVLDSWYLQAKRTNSVSFTMGLTSDKDHDRITAIESGNPATALFDNWDATKLPEYSAMKEGYATSSDIKIYDEAGIGHTMTVYYDQVATESQNYKITGLPAGYTMYEYIVTIPPEEDMRSFGGSYDPETKEWKETPSYMNETDPKTGKIINKNAGLLMTGHLIFDSGGNLVDQTAYTWQSTTPAGKDEDGNVIQPGARDPKLEKPATELKKPDEVADPGPTGTAEEQAAFIQYQKDLEAYNTNQQEWANYRAQVDAVNATSSDPNNMYSWTAARFSSNGLPVACVNFTGQPGASATGEGNTLAEDFLTEIDFGLRNLSGKAPESAQGRTLGDLVNGVVNPETGADGKPIDSRKNIDFTYFAAFDKVQRMENATSAGMSTFVTQDATQNGYTSGVLSGTNITNDGVVYGYYDNGETVGLYQIALYDFHNKQGLRREGGNLYAQTNESGEARQGVPGDNGFGATRAYNIEGSNVDMSREFVNMITTQRGFQANSKGVTTVDTMLETVIGMKR